MRQISFIDESRQDQSHRETVIQWLREYNQASNPRWMSDIQQLDSASNTLNLFAEIDGEIAGGLLAETFRKWLKVSIMAVDPGLRRQGIGRELITRAEDIARERGCCYSFVDTMQHQSPAFYLGCGYECAGELPDWDSYGNSKFFFRKALS